MRYCNRTEEAMLHPTPGVGSVVTIDGKHRETFPPGVWQLLPKPGNFLKKNKVKFGRREHDSSERLELRR